ncbi:translation initiation factor IF-3 [Candidatus Parcubacteria bacterium]|nr:MAG: translation initiation factor IF-3 [Candidatus Parcubacteria bacterium]
MRLIDEEGRQIDVLDRNKALELAQEKGLDLVEVAPQAKPPVVKLIDYNKFLYQLKKKKQEEKKKTVVSETKEIRLKPFIDKHDLDIKLKRVREFLQEGDKVRFSVLFTGRTLSKKEIGEKLLKGIIEELKNDAKVDREIHMEGRRMILLISKLK